MSKATDQQRARPGGWWVRHTGQRDPVVYVADVERLKRDASALLAACEKAAAAIDYGATARNSMIGAEGRALDALRAAIKRAKP